LAAPVLAGAAIAAKQGWGMVLAGCIAMIAAMALGATTSVWGVAVAGGATQIALPAGPGLLRAETYAPPPDIALGLVVLAQNVLVHFNLLVLPALILCRRASERHA
jgi:Pyruvate/2-oxoacid:ferredoxin oxidoreductase gamma subunit